MRLLYGFDDFVIACAAAEIAHHPILDFVFVGFGIVLQQSRSRHHLARSTNAALKSTVLDETFLDRIELAVFRQPFDGGKILAVDHYRECYARTDHVAIHQHGASAADSDAAALFGAGESQIITHTID